MFSDSSERSDSSLTEDSAALRASASVSTRPPLWRRRSMMVSPISPAASPSERRAASASAAPVSFTALSTAVTACSVFLIVDGASFRAARVWALTEASCRVASAYFVPSAPSDASSVEPTMAVVISARASTRQRIPGMRFSFIRERLLRLHRRFQGGRRWPEP